MPDLDLPPVAWNWQAFWDRLETDACPTVRELKENR